MFSFLLSIYLGLELYDNMVSYNYDYYHILSYIMNYQLIIDIINYHIR